MSAPERIFISYSHLDEAWKDRLIAHLRGLQYEGTLDVWDDRRIPAGELWRGALEDALNSATVAILVISKNFLGSRFIREEELAQILLHRTARGVRVIPLIAEPCAWHLIAALRDLQVRPKDGRPLSGGTPHDIDLALTALVVEVAGEHDGSPLLESFGPVALDSAPKTLRDLLTNNGSPAVQTLIAALLFICASGLLVVAVFVVAVIGAGDVNPIHYALILSGHCVAGVCRRCSSNDCAHGFIE